jgi:hypothetical protein
MSTPRGGEVHFQEAMERILAWSHWHHVAPDTVTWIADWLGHGKPFRVSKEMLLRSPPELYWLLYRFRPQGLRRTPFITTRSEPHYSAHWLGGTRFRVARWAIKGIPPRTIVCGSVEERNDVLEAWYDEPIWLQTLGELTHV